MVGSAILRSRRNYMSFKRILTNWFVVYFCWPSPDGTQSWHLVGHVTNEKPSLIFKVNNLKGKIKFHLKSPKHACGEFKIPRIPCKRPNGNSVTVFHRIAIHQIWEKSVKWPNCHWITIRLLDWIFPDLTNGNSVTKQSFGHSHSNANRVHPILGNLNCYLLSCD